MDFNDGELHLLLFFFVTINLSVVLAKCSQREPF